jgi:hypothetical protein
MALAFMGTSTMACTTSDDHWVLCYDSCHLEDFKTFDDYFNVLVYGPSFNFSCLSGLKLSSKIGHFGTTEEVNCIGLPPVQWRLKVVGVKCRADSVHFSQEGKKNFYGLCPFSRK